MDDDLLNTMVYDLALLRNTSVHSPVLQYPSDAAVTTGITVSSAYLRLLIALPPT